MYKDNIELVKKIFTLINLPYEEENIEDAFLFLDQYTIYFLNLRDLLEQEDAYLVDKLNKQVDYYNIVAKEINNDSFEIIADPKDTSGKIISCKDIIGQMDVQYDSKSLAQNIICQYVFWQRLETRINIKQCLQSGRDDCM